MKVKIVSPILYSGSKNLKSQNNVRTTFQTSKSTKSNTNTRTKCFLIRLSSIATFLVIFWCFWILFSYGFGGTFTSVRLILTLVSFIISIVSLIIPLTGQLRGIRRTLTIGFSSSTFILSPIVIYLLHAQIVKRWPELDVTVIRGPGTYRWILNTYDPIISDLLALIGVCISLIFNLFPFIISVFAHTKFGRACLPYRINDTEQCESQIVSAQAYESHAVNEKGQ